MKNEVICNKGVESVKAINLRELQQQLIMACLAERVLAMDTIGDIYSVTSGTFKKPVICLC